MPSKRATDRRILGERRVHERRNSTRYCTGTLIVIDGITWLDDEGNDRRHYIRRRQDREQIAARILKGRQSLGG